METKAGQAAVTVTVATMIESHTPVIRSDKKGNAIQGHGPVATQAMKEGNRCPGPRRRHQPARQTQTIFGATFQVTNQARRSDSAGWVFARCPSHQQETY